MKKGTKSRSQYDTHKPKELRRLYEPLGVLHELTMKGTTKPRSILSTSAQGISIMQRRRNFVDAIAYLGAYGKGCEIAVAVERQPDGLIVRIAGTGDVDGTVVPFVNDLLRMLSDTLKLGNDEIKGDNKESILICLSNFALDFAQEKVFAHYMKLLHHIAPVCLADMTTGLNEACRDSPDFKAWFQENFYKNGAPLPQEHMKFLAKECFKVRQSRLINNLREFIYQGHEHVAYFEKFYKQLRKLSLTIDMTSQLLESAISLRQDFANGLVAESIPSSPSLSIPLLPRKLTMEGIANRMFSDPLERDDFLLKLQQTAPPGLIQTLINYSQEVLTEVHPELLVINYFDTLSDIGFIDERDKYIGCAKPSCYLCHLFILYHPARYSMISSSSKIRLNWRLPDISVKEGNAMARAKNQKSVLHQLISTIRLQLEEKVENEWILQTRRTESEAQWTLPTDDGTSNYSPQPSSPASTPGYPITSTELRIPGLDTSSDETSSADKDPDRDEEDVILFKGRCRF
ncbi:hypothetical protein BDV38DRAFT_257969 [Aspergillus pseudotamarii]|uniref:Uncharacterized protein n=1 Tax=Aspergillus pseudotamarii TaxID=132259 RepID=A0A5N6SIQ9_ASPPS|nr:uncharacterized protein BDV38DRAFT_257969 [Aspergillus pseudotamarii]KAE8133561.1 hypothetical protein BDV38DRAFT_257969 [Aspergillus pseudotamarii]